MKTAAIAAVWVMLTATACTADVQTAVTVTSATTTSIEASVSFTGEAAETIASSAELENQLQELLVAYNTTQTEREFTDGTLTYTAQMDFEALLAAQGILGISGAELDGAEHPTLMLQLDRPQRLIAAIEATVADQPDSRALSHTMRASTMVSIQVIYPGGVQTATFTPTGQPATAVSISEDHVTYTQALSEFEPGELRVTGDPDAPLITGTRVIVAVSALGVLWWWRRRARIRSARSVGATHS